MKHPYLRTPAAVGLTTLLALALASAGVLAQEPKVKAPEPGVPEIFTLKGQFVRVAYNNEGYVTLGYRVANQSVGEEWMRLEVGLTVRTADQSYILKREHISLSTPDGKTLPLPTNQGVPTGGPAGPREPGAHWSATRSTTSRRWRREPARSASSPTSSRRNRWPSTRSS